MSLSDRFLKSCEENDLEDVKNCLDAGVDVNTVSEEDEEVFTATWSGLTIAAKQGYSDLLELLLSQPGIDVNIQTNHYHYMCPDWTPLMFACHEGNHEILRKLLQVPGVNVNHMDGSRWTAQHEAAAWGHSECLKELAKMPGVEWNGVGPNGRTPLFEALYSSNPDCVRIILAQPGLDLTVKDEDDLSLTEAAVTSLDIGEEFEEIVEILADVPGVDLNVKMSIGLSPIQFCLLWHVLGWGDTEKLKVLVKSRRVDVNIQNDAGITPILWCLKLRSKLKTKVGEEIAKKALKISISDEDGVEETLNIPDGKNVEEASKILLDCPRVELSSAITWAREKNKMSIVKEVGEVLESRAADAKNKLMRSWRGRFPFRAGGLRMDEMLMMKTRLQLKNFRKEIDESAKKRVGSNNDDDHEEKRLKRGAS